MTAVGWIGIWLLVGGLALIALELALIAPRLVRLRRRALRLQRVLASGQFARSQELQRLRLLNSELERLLRPYRRVRRWALHPLTVALVESYRRRRSRP
jgi:hypothetical protein